MARSRLFPRALPPRGLSPRVLPPGVFAGALALPLAVAVVIPQAFAGDSTAPRSALTDTQRAQAALTAPDAVSLQLAQEQSLARTSRAATLAAQQAAAEQAAAEKAAAERAAAEQRASRGGSRSGDPRAIAKAMLAARGQADQFSCLDRLWVKESGWKASATNPSSGAYGIPQALPAGKMASAGSDWRTNPATQIEWGLGYISDRYGSPCAAWSHSQRNNWY